MVEHNLPLKTIFDERRSSIVTTFDVRRPLEEENRASGLEGLLNWSLTLKSKSCLTYFQNIGFVASGFEVSKETTGFVVSDRK